MPIFESLIKVKHRCPFIDITTKYSDMSIYFCCNRKHELLEVIVEYKEQYDEVVQEVSKHANIVDESTDGLQARFVVSDCLCTPDNSVELIMDNLNIVHISPMICKGGWEYYSMMAFNQEDISKLIDRLWEKGYTVEIIKKVPFEGALSSTLLSTDAIFSGLTLKQRESLLLAFEHGYYSYPRRTDLQDIAKREHRPRTTFQEHLKRGENKLINAVIPYLRLFENVKAGRGSK